MFISTPMGLRGGGVGNSFGRVGVGLYWGGWRWVGTCGSEGWEANGDCIWVCGGVRVCGGCGVRGGG